MATGSEIQAALADAKENDLSFDDMALLLKRAITNAIVGGAASIELPWTSAGSRGTQITRSIAEAQQLMQQLLNLASGGIVGQYTEFTDTKRGGVQS